MSQGLRVVNGSTWLVSLALASACGGSRSYSEPDAGSHVHHDAIDAAPIDDVAIDAAPIDDAAIDAAPAIVCYGPDAGDPGSSSDGCATPPMGDWIGTAGWEARHGGSREGVSAEVRWTTTDAASIAG